MYRNLQNFLKNQNNGLRAYLYAFLLFLVVGAVCLIVLPYGEIVLWVNRHSAYEFDRLVDWITRIGLGSTMVIVSLGFALYKIRYSVMMLANLALVGLVTTLFKNLLFPHVVRPMKYFEPEVFHRMVHLQAYNLHHSFPSGHSMTIFAMMSLLAYFSGKRVVGYVCMFAAVIVGFTRIYLLQHFFVDVYAGAILGLACTFVTIWLGDSVMQLKQNNYFERPYVLNQLSRNLYSFFS